MPFRFPIFASLKHYFEIFHIRTIFYRNRFDVLIIMLLVTMWFMM